MNVPNIGPTMFVGRGVNYRTWVNLRNAIL